jgi:peptidoglycan/LPS O-acetylase OafA/YrhL
VRNDLPVTRSKPVDGLRGIAAGLVILAHSGCRNEGAFGVDIFFALSGFLVGGLLLDDTNLYRFFVRRTARIWPLALFTIALVLATGPADGVQWLGLWNMNSWRLQHEFDGRAAGFWSLAVEEHWYLLVPFLVRSMRRRELPLAFAFIGLSSIGLRWFWQIHGWPGWYMLTWTRLDGLCAGAIAAWILRERPSLAPLAVPVAVIAFALAATQIGERTWNRTGFLQATVFQPAGSVGTAALLLALTTGRAKWVATVLGLAPLAWLGQISYGLYLLHPLVIEVVGRKPVIVLIVTAVVAWMTHVLLEQPVIAWARARTSSPRAVPVLAQPPSDSPASAGPASGGGTALGGP